MGEAAGHIELERTVESITVGRRHRTELGDLDALVASIERDGLFQPLTITPDGVLVCGARRLAAIKKLRWKTVNVWVRSGISDRLGHLLAEQDDNALHKPFTQREATALYRELKTHMAEDAARRKAATQFSTDNQPGGNGSGKFPGPSTPLGEAREQAAAMIPGGASYKTLEKIDYLQQVADDPAQPESLRQLASSGLERIDADAPVDPIYANVRAAVGAAQSERETDLHELAREAVARATANPTNRARRPAPAQEGDAEPARYPVRAFVLTWGELADWWTHYDPDELASVLTEEQITSFLHTAAGTATFADQLRAAYDLRHDEQQHDERATASRGHLRAL